MNHFEVFIGNEPKRKKKIWIVIPPTLHMQLEGLFLLVLGICNLLMFVEIMFSIQVCVLKETYLKLCGYFKVCYLFNKNHKKSLYLKYAS